MIPRFTPLLSACVFLTLACAKTVAATTSANMTCDGKYFQLQTQMSHSPAGISWQNQTLFTNGERVILQDTPATPADKALPAAITGWQCVTGAHSKVLVLAYSCASDAPDACSGHQEWIRLVAPDGHLLDAGLKPADNRLPLLLSALGIDAQSRAGIQMRDVIK